MQILRLIASHAHDIYLCWPDCCTNRIELEDKVCGLVIYNPTQLHTQSIQAVAKIDVVALTSPSSTALL